MNIIEKELSSVFGDNLTVKKVEHIIQRDNSVITGFVLTDKSGNVAIVDKAAVRWLSKDEWWKLFHG